MNRTLLVALLAIATGCRQEAPKSTAAPPPEPALTQIEALAQEIVMHTPEHVHYAEGTSFAWVFIPTSEVKADSSLTAEVLTQLKKRYRVYQTESEIPSGDVIRDGELLSYRDGFRFEFNARQIDASHVEVEYSDYEGPLSASSRTVTYEWNGSSWVPTKESPLLMSQQRPNHRVNAPVHPVTPLAVASVAPVRPARYARR